MTIAADSGRSEFRGEATATPIMDHHTYPHDGLIADG
jgi:hypothetical protein